MQFNNTKETVAERTETTNHEGGLAFEPDSPELALSKVVINNLLESTYYESDEEQFDAVEAAFDACAEENAEFVLKLAKYARQEENLRQVPQALFVLSVEDERTRDFAEDYARGIMSRTDEPLEVLALWVSRNGKTIPGVLKRSIEDAMHQWNEWQYAKWDQPNKEFQYRDLLNLVHPAPSDSERDRIFEKIAHGDLDDYPDVESLTQQDTWESSLSADNDQSKAEKYRAELEEDEDGYSMGLFPRVRQCRDMLEAGLSAEEIFGDVTDEWIQNSRLYPFRFYQAYKAINGGVTMSRGLFGDSGTPAGIDAPAGEVNAAKDFLEHAMEVSTANLPDVLEDTFIGVDTSGSMSSSVSNDSDLQCVEIASLFGSLLYRRSADLAAFASDTMQYHGDRRDTITSTMENIQSMSVGGGTNGYLIPKALRQNDMTDYNQVVIFTDMQMWNSGYGSETFQDEWNKYKQVNPDASLYLVDLNSYGDLVTPEGAQDVYNLSGWTENVIDFIDRMENTGDFIRGIEQTEPDK